MGTYSAMFLLTHYLRPQRRGSHLVGRQPKIGVKVGPDHQDWKYSLVPVSSTTICQAECARTQNLALMYDSWTRAAPAVRYRGWIRKIQCLRSSVTMISGHISEVGVLIFPETRRPGDNFFGLARRDRLLEDFGQFFAYFLGEAIHLLW